VIIQLHNVKFRAVRCTTDRLVTLYLTSYFFIVTLEYFLSNFPE